MVAIGKAAGAMAAGAVDVLGERVAGALVVTVPGAVSTIDVLQNARVRVIESAHPRPDARSLMAGLAVVEFVRGLPRSARMLWLISGGASSLVEVPSPGITLEELQRVNDWLLGSGLGIASINAVRRRLSRLKGGGLAALAAPRPGLALMISDVPGDDPAVIGSGLLHRSRRREPAAAFAAGRSRRRACALPGAARPGVRRRGWRRGSSQPTVMPGWRHATAPGAADGSRCAPGAASSPATRPISAEPSRGASPRPRRARSGSGAANRPSSCLPIPGRGGRNQHLALAAALAMAGETGLTLLAAGTDGIDGSSDDAGAIVDDSTCARGAAAGLDGPEHLLRADSGTYLEECGDLLHTGPTYTNVGDLVLGLKDTTR